MLSIMLTIIFWADFAAEWKHWRGEKIVGSLNEDKIPVEAFVGEY